MLIWSNIDIYIFFFFFQKVLALSSGHFKPFQIFLLPVFTVTIPAMYINSFEVIVYKYKPMDFNHFEN